MGHGGLKEGQIINKMQEYYQKDHQAVVTDEDILENLGGTAYAGYKGKPEAGKKGGSGITVKGLTDIAVRFSKCCSPVPGDEIIGFVTRGRGVSIHRTDCVNIINLSEMERDRLLEADWAVDSGEAGLFMAEIKIYGNNRTGLLVDITRILTERQIDIDSVHSKTSKQGIATITLAFSIRSKDELNSLVDKIRQVESVIDIERTTG